MSPYLKYGRGMTAATAQTAPERQCDMSNTYV
jgi:hypothetical protein